jgi:hypothetical protein
MYKNYWQPNIDNWILTENDAENFMPNINSANYGGNVYGSKAPMGIKQEEEEHDVLEQPYKGITTLSRLKDQINQILEDIYGLSKVEKDSDNSTNPYEKIIQMIQNPDLKAMLDIASDELKKRNLSSF